MGLGVGFCCCGQCPTIPYDDIEGAEYKLTISGVEGCGEGSSTPLCRQFLCGFYNGVWDGSDLNGHRPPLTFSFENAFFYGYRGTSVAIPYNPQEGSGQCLGSAVNIVQILFAKPDIADGSLICEEFSPTINVPVLIQMATSFTDGSGTQTYGMHFSCFREDFPDWTNCLPLPCGASGICNRDGVIITDVVRVA